MGWSKWACTEGQQMGVHRRAANVRAQQDSQWKMDVHSRAANGRVQQGSKRMCIGARCYYGRAKFIQTYTYSVNTIHSECKDLPQGHGRSYIGMAITIIIQTYTYPVNTIHSECKDLQQ